LGGILVSITVVSSLPTPAQASSGAKRDSTTNAVDNARDGWDSNEPSLKSAVIGGKFQQLFQTNVVGEVYAEPVVYQDRKPAKSRLIVATEADHLYGLDPITGAIAWDQTVGTPEPSGDGQPINCPDLTPTVGITSTPAVDVATHTVYVVFQDWNGSAGRMVFGAYDAIDGTPSWTRSVAGTASNDPNATFNPASQNQRTGLLLVHGHLYAGFAGFCDEGAYLGWIIGVDVVTSAHPLTLWTDMPGQAPSARGGIWQSGAGLTADHRGNLYLMTGNGPYPNPDVPLAGSQAGSNTVPLSNSFVRLKISGTDGSLQATDFFMPHDTHMLSDRDKDLGSGGVTLIPPSMVPASIAAKHPHLLIGGGKNGTLYILDRSHLGGFAGNPSAPDDKPMALAQFSTLPTTQGLTGQSAVWPGDGGYIYCATTFTGDPGLLRSFQLSAQGGTLEISNTGSSPTFYGSLSGAPLVTSNHRLDGSALVWVIERRVGSETTDELRAYDAVPSNGVLNEVWHAPIGKATKFSTPTSYGGRVYAATLDGYVDGYGVAVAP
jgi:hypothetical protein